MFVVYFLVLFLAMLMGCRNGDSGNLTFETALSLLNAGGQEATTFSSGAPITLRLSIRNLTDSSQTLTLPSTQQYDFLIWQVGQDGSTSIIWRWSESKGFPAVITELSFAPREEKIFSETWSQTGAGNFNAQGFIATSSELLNTSFTPTETRSPVVPFTINP